MYLLTLQENAMNAMNNIVPFKIFYNHLISFGKWLWNNIYYVFVGILVADILVTLVFVGSL